MYADEKIRGKDRIYYMFTLPRLTTVDWTLSGKEFFEMNFPTNAP